MQANNSILLHIESATDICSVALSRGKELLSIRESKGSRSHASQITLFIEEALDLAGLKISDVSALVLSEGPGSYTSLRVGMSVAKGICFGLDVPLIAVNTLHSLACAARDKHPGFDLICPMIDARRMEVYASLYDDQMHLLHENRPVILEADSFDTYFNSGRSILFCGNGAHKSRDLYGDRNCLFSSVECSAKNLVEPGFDSFVKEAFEDFAYFAPNYIKSPNITMAKKRLL